MGTKGGGRISQSIRAGFPYYREPPLNLMSIIHTPPPDGLVTVDDFDGGKCRITVDPKSAQSLIHFLLEKGVRLLPPEGGVARNPEYQIEMAGVPEMHSFFAYESSEHLEQLKGEWQARRSRAHPDAPHGPSPAQHAIHSRIDSPPWLAWAQKLAALSQNGLAYTKDPFDIERYEAIRTISAEILAAGTDAPLEVIKNLLGGEQGYATPKVEVRGVVFKEDALLLVRERTDEGHWTIPGGWADVLESPGECVVKEIQEETGYETRAVKLLAVYDRNRHPHVPVSRDHIYKIFILCEITGGVPAESVETNGSAFFREQELPANISVSRVTAGQIRSMFAHRRNPGLPTDFD